MRKYLVVIASFIIAVVILTACSSKNSVSSSNKEKLESVQLPNEKDQNIVLQLYFDATKENANASDVKKEEILINKEELLGELVVNQLIKGPSTESRLAPVLPKDTRLISFSIKDGIAIVNLSKEAKVTMPAVKEEACLKSIVMSLAQLESINKVQIQIESKIPDTLGGNYDISKPFSESEIPSMLKK